MTGALAGVAIATHAAPASANGKEQRKIQLKL